MLLGGLLGLALPGMAGSKVGRYVGIIIGVSFGVGSFVWLWSCGYRFTGILSFRYGGYQNSLAGGITTSMGVFMTTEVREMLISG